MRSSNSASCWPERRTRVPPPARSPSAAVFQGGDSAHRPRSRAAGILRELRRRIGEMDRVNAEGARGGCVRLDIVDEDGAQRIDREALQQNLIDAWLRLDRANL